MGDFFSNFVAFSQYLNIILVLEKSVMNTKKGEIKALEYKVGPNASS